MKRDFEPFREAVIAGRRRGLSWARVAKEVVKAPDRTVYDWAISAGLPQDVMDRRAVHKNQALTLPSEVSWESTALRTANNRVCDAKFAEAMAGRTFSSEKVSRDRRIFRPTATFVHSKSPMADL